MYNLKNTEEKENSKSTAKPFNKTIWAHWYTYNLSIIKYLSFIYLLYIYRPVHKGHSRECENVAFMSNCPLYTG